MSQPTAKPGHDRQKPGDAASGRNDRPRRRGCLARLLRGCGWTLLVIVALLLVGYFVEVYRCSRFAPTGDALFDRYARAVIRHQAWRLFHGGGTHPATLPDELLAEWEDDFGDDPRFWQLRYWCCLNRDSRMSTDPGGSAPLEARAEAVVFLESAQSRGVVDADLMYALLDCRRRMWSREVSRQQYELMELPEDQYKGEVRVLFELDEKRQLELLNEYVAVEPEQAWPWYERARYWDEYGELNLMLADLRAGNDASTIELPRAFPVSFVMDSAAAGEQPGSAAVAGAALEVYNAAPSINYIRLKEVGKAVLAAFALGGNQELLSEFHEFGCKFGEARRGGVSERLTSSALLAQQAEYLLAENGADLTAIQRRSLLYVIEQHWSNWLEVNHWGTKRIERELGLQLLERWKWRSSALGDLRMFPDPFAHLDEPRPLHQAVAAWAKLLSYHCPPERYFAFHDSYAAESALCREKLEPILRSLQELDYATLEYPSDWDMRGVSPHNPYVK